MPKDTKRSKAKGGLQLGSDLPNQELERNAARLRQENRSPYRKAFDRAISELRRKKLLTSLDEAPGEELWPAPDDPVSLGPAIFKYFENARKWWEYILTVVAELEARKHLAKEELSRIEADLKDQNLSPSKIKKNGDYVACKAELIETETQLTLLEPKKKELDKRMSLFSRSVEGSKMDYRHSVREGNLGRGPRGGGGDLPPNL